MNECLEEPEALGMSQAPEPDSTFDSGQGSRWSAEAVLWAVPRAPHLLTPRTAYQVKQEERGQGGVREDGEGLGLQLGGEGKARGGHGEVWRGGGPDEELHLHVREHLGHLHPPVGTTNEQGNFI